ncbi:MAG: serine hydrolase [Bacteroidota bacterium]
MKLIRRTLLLLVLIGLAWIGWNFPKLNNVRKTLTFFDQENILGNFTQMHAFADTHQVTASAQPFVFPKGDAIELPTSFDFEGRTFSGQEFWDSSYTNGLVVIQSDHLVFERYDGGREASGQHISWSVAKSVVSALFGIAMEEGKIKSLDEPVEVYVPELIGSGYEGVTIKDVLQMSTGVKFNEDYGDLSSDINRWGRTFAWGASQDEFATTLVNEREPGTYHHYVSINTHVLGMILVRATGQTLAEYLQEKLWHPIGAEYMAYWLADDAGMEMALGGLNACLRDYAKVGQLFLHEGKWQGEQLVPAEWVRASTTPDAPHVTPGMRDNSAHAPYGYGYQWWIPIGNEGEYMAQGVYNQYIYINPTTGTVIAKNSANHRYNDKSVPFSTTAGHLAFFRAIAHQMAKVDTMAMEPIAAHP